jgi:hypothetical protein
VPLDCALGTVCRASFDGSMIVGMAPNQAINRRFKTFGG